MSENTATGELMLNPNNPREREMMIIEREFSMLQRKAMALSKASVIPKEYVGNIPNCMVAMEMANRLGVGDLEIMQNLDIIHGRPSFRATYLIAMVNKSQVLKGRLRFKFTGEKGKPTWGCIAYGTCAETGEVLDGTEITIQIAMDEGWYGKNGSKWKTIPEQMLMYRAASFWSRIYAPDATMGMHTTDEVADYPESRDVVGGQTVEIKTSDLNQSLKAAKEAKPAAKAKPKAEPKPEPEPEVEALSFSYAEVADAIHKATSEDELTDAIDMIRAVPYQFRAELEELSDKRYAEITDTSAAGAFEQG